MKANYSDLKPFKARCSQLGIIMTNGTDKKTIGKTAITYLQEWLVSQVTGKQKEFTSMAMQKGTVLEDKAIEQYANYRNLGFVLKNEKHYSNDFIHGMPDIVLADTIIDIKCAEDVYTFGYFDDGMDKNHYWQLQGYMGLTGRKHAKIVKILLDAPDFYVDQKSRWKANELVNTTGADFDDIYYDIYTEMKERYTFEHLPIELRIKEIETEFDPIQWQAVQDRVNECREIIKQLIKN